MQDTEHKKASSGFFARYFGKKVFPYWCVLIVDSFIVAASLILAHVFNTGWFNQGDQFIHFLWSLAIYLACYMVFFKVFHTYRGIIRYSSFVDLWRVACAVFAGSALVQLLRWSLRTDNVLAAVSAHDLAIGSMIAIIGMSLLRVIIKVLFDTTDTKTVKLENVLVFGAKEGGMAIAKSIRDQRPQQYKVVAFVTDIQDMVGHTLMSAPVYAPDDQNLWNLIHKDKIKKIFVSPMAYGNFVNNNQKMIGRLIDENIKIMVVPQTLVWDGKSPLNYNLLQEVSVEDLLPREPIQINMDAIGRMLKGKSIMVTGGAGSIGSEMVRQIAKFGPKEIVIVDQAETPMHDMRLEMKRDYPTVEVETLVSSITNEPLMEEVFKLHRPQYVFHAAAYKHVPMMEDLPAVAVQNNVAGTRIIADLAVKYGTEKFVMISTDKAVNPANVMGCSKRICEIYCQALNAKVQQEGGVTQFVTTRFGNVLGSNGSVIPIFMDQIKCGGPVTVTHKDMVRFFMLIPEACKLVLEAGTMGKGGEIFVFDMGAPVKILDLANRMISLSGAKGVKVVFSGLRDGEKLYEEVLSDMEATKPTPHPKIRVAAVREYPYEEILRQEQELLEISRTKDRMTIVAKMKEIVPEFRSCHSAYEKLDSARATRKER
ncbi:MAG: polysaccharide biosynthesis protein [Bacteroidales bacterium]|nr:polysaccharide biosynthesis protein [Candidatus Equibacterium intestinale]